MRPEQAETVSKGIPMRVQESAALDRKLRRKANRKQRRKGGHQFDLAAMQVQSEQSTRLRCTLSELAASGTAGEKIEARRSKKRLNTTQVRKEFDRQGLRGFWDYNAA